MSILLQILLLIKKINNNSSGTISNTKEAEEDRAERSIEDVENDLAKVQERLLQIQSAMKNAPPEKHSIYVNELKKLFQFAEYLKKEMMSDSNFKNYSNDLTTSISTTTTKFDRVDSDEGLHQEIVDLTSQLIQAEENTATVRASLVSKVNQLKSTQSSSFATSSDMASSGSTSDMKDVNLIYSELMSLEKQYNLLCEEIESKDVNEEKQKLIKDQLLAIDAEVNTMEKHFKETVMKVDSSALSLLDKKTKYDIENTIGGISVQPSTADCHNIREQIVSLLSKYNVHALQNNQLASVIVESVIFNVKDKSHLNKNGWQHELSNITSAKDFLNLLLTDSTVGEMSVGLYLSQLFAILLASRVNNKRLDALATCVATKLLEY
jgi:hypothetical protein